MSGKPVFLMGHLRSGTTFLHRLLGKADSLNGMTLQKMIFGTGRYGQLVDMVLGKKLSTLSLDKAYNPIIHKTGFDLLESDDIAFYFQRFGGLLYWIYFMAWKAYSSERELEESIVKVLDDSQFLEVQEALYDSSGAPHQRMFSKSFFGIYQLEKLMNRYPDARFLVLVRDPKEVIPSTLSLEVGIQQKLSNFDHKPANLQKRYIRNVYTQIKIYYDKLESHMHKGYSQVYFLRYENLRNNLESSMQTVIRFLELEHDHGLKEAIQNQLQQQPDYQSAHQYSLSEYGISEQEIESDFRTYYLRKNQEGSHTS